ncbi:MAG: helix-turn-helix domain-containing protein [Chloroflexota bacterium]|nr:helix-turn-helix domain-containing protein [Chloroflexota bacterium]MDQ5865808.1 helix-turn-helix domain-containing protein [Chloroflexota bacterium]
MTDPLAGAYSEHIAPLVEAMRADPQKAAYYLDLLEPLRQYDREHHGDLLKTLSAYLRHGGNSAQTANALFIHRNSLRYRLSRIQALTALDPDDPDARLALQIALVLNTGLHPTNLKPAIERSEGSKT